MSTIDAAIIKHITEGGSGGGNEDILKRVPGQTITFTDDPTLGLILDITITEPGFYIYSGCVLRLYNKNTQQYDDWMIIPYNEIPYENEYRGNTYLFYKALRSSLTNATVYKRGQAFYLIMRGFNSPDNYSCNQSEYPEVGIYDYEYMSPTSHIHLLKSQAYSG